MIACYFSVYAFPASLVAHRLGFTAYVWKLSDLMCDLYLFKSLELARKLDLENLKVVAEKGVEMLRVMEEESGLEKLGLRDDLETLMRVISCLESGNA